MFSNFLSFRDVTLYVLPGNISTYLFLRILHLYHINPFPDLISGTSASIGLLFIFAAFSTCIGFLQSQLVIRLFNIKMRKGGQSPYLLANLALDGKLTANITAKIRKEFDLDKGQPFSHSILLACSSYVFLRASEHSSAYTRRLMNFSLFSSVIAIPLTMGLFFFLCKLNMLAWLKWCLLPLVFSGVFFISYRLANDFRKQWVKHVLLLFLSLPKDNGSARKD